MSNIKQPGLTDIEKFGEKKFQAGLKRAAEIAAEKKPKYSQYITGWATAQARITAEEIERAILEEMK